MRLDVYLYTSGYASSRQRASCLIKEGLVRVEGKTVRKPSFETDGKAVEVQEGGLRYVSRGGLKLEEAIKRFSFDPTGLVCLDLGASTGGFTDCLLQHGAKKVYALDVGFGQLAASLRSDIRGAVLEHYNARNLEKKDFEEPVDAVVSDLSFISQRLIYPAVSGVLSPGMPFISLVKPQFEAGRGAVGKGGLVKDRQVHWRVMQELISEGMKSRLYLSDFCVSPIEGGDGNREYLALFRKDSPCVCDEHRLKAVIFYDK